MKKTVIYKVKQINTRTGQETTLWNDFDTYEKAEQQLEIEASKYFSSDPYYPRLAFKIEKVYLFTGIMGNLKSLKDRE